MLCPVDRQELTEKEYESGIKVDGCPDCHGAWLDKGELERIQASLEHDFADDIRAVPDTVGRAYAMARAEEAPPRQCPKCGTTLDRVEHGYTSQILVDVCRRCGGVWLDRGELEALELFFERSRRDTAAIRRGFFGSLLGLFGR